MKDYSFQMVAKSAINDDQFGCTSDNENVAVNEYLKNATDLIDKKAVKEDKKINKYAKPGNFF